MEFFSSLTLLQKVFDGQKFPPTHSSFHSGDGFGYIHKRTTISTLKVGVFPEDLVQLPICQNNFPGICNTGTPYCRLWVQITYNDQLLLIISDALHQAIYIFYECRKGDSGREIASIQMPSVEVYLNITVLRQTFYTSVPIQYLYVYIHTIILYVVTRLGYIHVQFTDSNQIGVIFFIATM